MGKSKLNVRLKLNTADKAFEGLTAEMFTPQQLVVQLWAAVDIHLYFAEPVSRKFGKSTHDLEKNSAMFLLFHDLFMLY